MKKFTLEAYNMEDECIGGGYVYAIDDCDARKQIEQQIENDIDEFTESGYFTHKIVGVSEDKMFEMIMLTGSKHDIDAKLKFHEWKLGLREDFR